MPTTTREHRKALILEAQTMVAGGASDHQVAEFLVKEKGCSRPTAYRYIAAAWREWNLARIRHSRDHRLGRALAIRDRAMRLALTNRRHVIVGDKLESVPDPDVKTYLAAADSEAKLLGLNAPEKRELVLGGVGLLMQDWIDVLVRKVMDVPLRQSILEEMQRVQATRLKEIESGTLQAMKQVEARVVDAAPPPPSANGEHQNGEAR